jgi:hypothetical protein
MEASLKRILKSVTLELRHLLEGRCDNAGAWQPGDLENRLASIGVRGDREPRPADELRLSTEDRHARRVVDAYLKLREEAGVPRADAVAEFLRETAYTWANRLIALRCMESRELIDPVILQQEPYGGRSLEHHRLAQRQPELCAGEDDGLFALLDKVFREQAERLPMLFDPQSPGIVLRPSPAAIKDCFGLLSLNSEILRKYRIRIKEDENAIADTEPPNPFVVPDALGWTYQYWNTEEKDRVFEKVRTVKGAKISGADIVPATQLYTEDYMVKFLVQNSLGATWMGMHPESRLQDGWEYYVRDADRAPIQHKPVREITFIDPACGSGHFLIEAFDIFYAMYQEEGELTEPAEICSAILSQNLFGIDIDTRAVQIAEAALWMKAAERASDFSGAATNLVAATASHLKGPAWEEFLAGFKNEPSVARVLCRFAKTMEHIDEIGSLARPAEDLAEIVKSEHNTWEEQIRVQEGSNFLFPELRADALSGQLPFQEISDEEFGYRLMNRARFALDAFTVRARESGDFDDQMIASETLAGFRLLELLGGKYDVVAANPPYLGFRKMTGFAHTFLKKEYPRSCYDLYAVFIERSLELACDGGRMAIVTMHSYMFVPSLSGLREMLVNDHELEMIAHLGAGAFDELGDHAPAVLTICVKGRFTDTSDRTLCIIPYDAERNKSRLLLQKKGRFEISKTQFSKLPGTPFAYSLPRQLVELFTKHPLLGRRIDYRNGMFTSNNPRFVRQFWECRSKRWRPYFKVPTSERWYVPTQYFVDWNNNGDRLKSYSLDRNSTYTFNIVNERYFFRPGFVLKATGSMGPCAKILDPGQICDIESTGIFCDLHEHAELLFLHNSRLAIALLHVLNPTPHFYIADLERLPYVQASTHHQNTFDVLLMEIVLRKRELHRLELDGLDFAPTRLGGGSFRTLAAREQTVKMHAGLHIAIIEACAESLIMEMYKLDEESAGYVRRTAGIPVGLLPLCEKDLVSFSSVPSASSALSRIVNNFLPQLPCQAEAYDKQLTTAFLKAAYEANDSQKFTFEDVRQSTNDVSDEPAEDDIQSVKCPHETFLQEASEHVSLNPISVHTILVNGIESEGWRSPLAEAEVTAAICSTVALRLLGHLWPKQIEVGDAAPSWADSDGIIPITALAGEPTLAARVEERLRTDEIEASDFIEIMSKPLEAWLATEFFKHHTKQFKKRPIAWQVQSSGFTARSTPAIACLLYYHKLDSDLLQKVRKLAEDLRKTRETELRGIISIKSDARSERQENRRVELEDAIVELQRFDATLETVAATGFGPDSLRPVLRQNAINDAMLVLKCRWLHRLNQLVTKGPLDRWLRVASETDLHPNFSSWIADALSSLDHFCARVAPQPPDQEKLVDDPTAADLAALIAAEAETMFTTSLRLACDVWWKPFHETVIQPVKDQVKELKEEQKQSEARLKADTEKEPSVVRELKARVKELKAEIKKLNAEIDKKAGLAQGVRNLIEAWRSSEPATWGDWLSEQPLFDQISSLDDRRTPPNTIAAFVAQESLYAPDINDGVRVNIAPLQKAGLLPADVLAAKDIPKAIADRAEWRSDERRWVREGKLPQPGWWPEPEVKQKGSS